MRKKHMNLKQKIKNNKQVFGTWCIIPSPEVVNIIAKSGLDFVIIDMEHGPVDFITAQRMIMAAEVCDCEALVRVPGNNEQYILRALDIGASGIIVPHVETEKNLKAAVSFIKYPPVGKRGYSPYTKAGGYSYRVNYTFEENERVLTGIILEGRHGLDNISKILNEKELDVVYIGTYDISVSLGIPGKVQDRAVLRILENSVKKINKAGKTAGCLFHDLKELKYFKEIGVGFLTYKVDSNIIYDAYHSINSLK